MRRLLGWLVPLCALVGCEAAHDLTFHLPRIKSVAPMPAATATPEPSPTDVVRVYFTRPGTSPDEPTNIAKMLCGYIGKARKTLDVCGFELDNKVIVQAITAASQRGVKVRVVTETDYLKESGITQMHAIGVPVVDDKRSGALMHNKFMVFDERAVWSGSMNFTENCAYKNNNNGFFINDARIAANYAAKFSWMFDEHKFGGAPKGLKIPNPVVTLADGTTVENYFSTHDHIAKHAIEKIDQAKTTLHFLAFSFTHEAMAKAMLGRASAGVQVQGVFEKSQATSSYCKYDMMRGFGHGVEVYLDANPRNMHHKVLIIDSETTMAGSFNFSDGADKQNDENVVIFKSRSIAAQFEQEFQRVFGDAKAADGKVTTARKSK